MLLGEEMREWDWVTGRERGERRREETFVICKVPLILCALPYLSRAVTRRIRVDMLGVSVRPSL